MWTYTGFVKHPSGKDVSRDRESLAKTTSLAASRTNRDELARLS